MGDDIVVVPLKIDAMEREIDGIESEILATETKVRIDGGRKGGVTIASEGWEGLHRIRFNQIALFLGGK